MKTKPWSVRPSAELTKQLGPSILQPTFFETGEGEYIGPSPLGLTILKGMEFARALKPFRIADESDRTLVELRKNNLIGNPDLVGLLVAMLDVSRTLYQSYFITAKEQLTNELQETRQSDSNSAEVKSN